MSLLRLLTAGRCWISAKPMGRYKFTDPRSMPKFGAGPNPFKGKVGEEKREEESGRETGEGPLKEAAEPQREEDFAVEEVERERKAKGSGGSGEKAAGEKMEDSKPQAAEEEEKEKEVKVGTGWISRVGSLTSSLRMKLWRPRKSGPPPRPVQCELSLDN